MEPLTYGLLKWLRTSNESAKKIFKFQFNLYVDEILFSSKRCWDKCHTTIIINRTESEQKKKILETKRQANGLRIAKKIPVFACQWQFLSHFRSSFDWIDIDFYFTTSIFHTHSALVMIRCWCDDHCCSWHSCSWCTSRSSNYHKNKNGSHFIYVLFSI